MGASIPPNDKPIERFDELLDVFRSAEKPRSEWRVGAEMEKFGVVQTELDGALHGDEALDGVNTLANLSNVGFGMGVLGLGTAIAGLVISRRPTNLENRRATIVPFVGPGMVGLGGTY